MKKSVVWGYLHHIPVIDKLLPFCLSLAILAQTHTLTGEFNEIS